MTFIDRYLENATGDERDLDAAWAMVMRGSPAETNKDRPGFNRFWKTYREVARRGLFERVGEQSFKTTFTYTPVANGAKIDESTYFVLRRVDGDLRLYEIRKVDDG